MTSSEKTKCHAIIHSAATSAGAAGAGLAQIPLSDAAVITPIQITMIIAIGKVFDKTITKSVAASILASSVATVGGRGVSQVLVGWVPGLGNALNASTAFAITEGIGWFAANYFDSENEELKSLKNSNKNKIKYIIWTVVLVAIVVLMSFWVLRPASGGESEGSGSLFFHPAVYMIFTAVIAALLGRRGLLNVLKAILKCFKFLAGWIGTIPTIIAGIHLWGNDSLFQKLVKGTVSTVGALLSWLTGYRKGYEKGYQDAQANRQKRWWKVLWPF